MDYHRLGAAGVRVSRLCLGCMTYGDPKRGVHEWTLPEDEARLFIRQALEAGINFFDTANNYSAGSSEEILGRAVKDFARREEVVIATKVYAPMRQDPNGRGLSRKAILAEVEASLKRLGTDYIDLYQIHRFDPETPLEETLGALDDLVRAGKVLYLGASSMAAWQFMKALAIAGERGWSRFVSMQNHLNLIYREEEREMLPLCADQGVGVLPWSPLARGKLARPWSEEPATERERTDLFGSALYARTRAADKAVIDTLGEVAAGLGAPRSQVALAWLLRKPEVTAPIVGASKPGHLEDALAAVTLKLDDGVVARLEAGYVPHPVLGF
ncbi:MAG TPA: aldo/keto reductase [Caulobacteraceae bacterium]|jgi:aryl-alcohol dehydrogenase-like predicted oxidoreductase|nr:aldo/keto reductase [Caulobacteraceae bacterium]